jgi:hypothetical protein
VDPLITGVKAGAIIPHRSGCVGRSRPNSARAVTAAWVGSVSAVSLGASIRHSHLSPETDRSWHAARTPTRYP